MILNNVIHILNFKLQKHNWFNETLGLDPTCNWKIREVLWDWIHFRTISLSQLPARIHISIKLQFWVDSLFFQPMCLTVTEEQWYACNCGFMLSQSTLAHNPKFLFCVLVCSLDISRYSKQVLKVLCPFSNSGLFLMKFL